MSVVTPIVFFGQASWLEVHNPSTNGESPWTVNFPNAATANPTQNLAIVAAITCSWGNAISGGMYNPPVTASDITATFDGLPCQVAIESLDPTNTGGYGNQRGILVLLCLVPTTHTFVSPVFTITLAPGGADGAFLTNGYCGVAENVSPSMILNLIANNETTITDPPSLYNQETPSGAVFAGDCTVGINYFAYAVANPTSYNATGLLGTYTLQQNNSSGFLAWSAIQSTSGTEQITYASTADSPNRNGQIASFFDLVVVGTFTPTYNPPTDLTGSIPNPVTAPLQGSLSWTAATKIVGGTPPPAYDIYRNGVSIAVITGSPPATTYTDNVPSTGTYSYDVAASNGTMDVSFPSNTINLTYATSTGGRATFVNDEGIGGGYFGGVLNLVEFVYMPTREPFVAGATNLILNRYKQEPTDSRQRGVDYTYFLAPGETLTNVSMTGISAQGVAQADTDPLVTPLVVTDIIIDPVTQAKFAYTVSGGQDGVEYTVQFTTTTSVQTSTVEEIFSINILIENSFP